MKLHIVDHPLIAHKLTMMRDKNCNSKNFRELCGEIASLMTYEVTRDGLLNGVLRMVPHAHVGHIGLYRDPVTHEPHEYYCGLPKQLDAKCIVVDPMLATGGSAAAAITMLKRHGLKHITLMVLVAAPQGVELVNKEHPDVEIYTAALDRGLNDKAYILPGLGDAGDRVFGTL